MVKKQKCRLKFDQPYCTTAEGAPVICAIRHQKKILPQLFPGSILLPPANWVDAPECDKLATNVDRRKYCQLLSTGGGR